MRPGRFILLIPAVIAAGYTRFWLDFGYEQQCAVPYAEFDIHIVKNFAPSSAVTGFLVRNGDDCTGKRRSEEFACVVDPIEEVFTSVGNIKIVCHVRTSGEFVGSVAVCLCQGSSCELPGTLATFFIAPPVAEHEVSPENGAKGERLMAGEAVSCLSSISDFLLVGDISGYISLIDWLTGEEKFKMKHVEEELLIRSVESTGGHAGLFQTEITSVVSNADGFFVSAGRDYRVVVWKPVSVGTGFAKVASVRMQYPVERVVFEDRRILVGTSNGKVDVLDLVKEGTSEDVWRLETVATFFVGCWVSGMTWVKFPSEYAVACGDGQLLIWKLDDVVVPVLVARQASGFLGLVMYKEELITADAAGMMKRWNATSGEELAGWTIREGTGQTGVGQSIEVWEDYVIARTKDAVHIFELAPVEEESGFWETITLEDLTESAGTNLAVDGIQYNWRAFRQGRLDNRLYVNRTVGRIEFHPCNAVGTSDCASGLIGSEERVDAPIVEANFLLAFEFTKVKGSLEYEPVYGTQGVVEDCRAGQQPLARWSDNFKNFWSLVVTNKYAKTGCEILDFSLFDGFHTTAASCRAECASRPECNAVHMILQHASESVSACEFRRCVDFLQITFTPVTVASDSVHQFWVYTNVDVAADSAAVAPTTGGFIAFGTREEVVYGGCGGKAVAGVITFSETAVEAANSLRFQVSQVRRDSAVRIKALNFQVYRSVYASRRVFREASNAMRVLDEYRDGGDFAMSGRQYTGGNLAIVNGVIFGSIGNREIGMWDLRPAGMYVEIEMGFTRRVIDEEPVDPDFEYRAELGEAFDLVLVTPVGGHGTPEVVLTKSTFCGAPGSHKMDEAVQLGRMEAEGAKLRFMDTIINTPGEYLVCVCTSTCCKDQASRFAGNYAGTVTVAGPVERENYYVCIWGAVCEIRDFAGVGLERGDRLVVLPKPADPGERDVCGGGGLNREGLFPLDGFLVTRTEDGRYYRTEETDGQAATVGQPALAGKTFMLCWCRGGSDQCNNDMANYNVLAGYLTLVRFDREPGKMYACVTNGDCVVKIKGDSGPRNKGDVVMVKEGECKGGEVVEKIGKKGRSEIYSGDGELIFGFGKIGMEVSIGIYSVCWCQGSMRECKNAEEFTVDVGQKLKIEKPTYLFPDSCGLDFTAWREPWATTDDCCCNFKEAGANPGCEEPGFVADVCVDARYVINL